MKNMHLSVISAIAAMLLVSLPSQAASFNCKKAGNATEKAICANSRLSEADVKLANTYNILLRFASSDYAHYDIRSDQQDWLKRRNMCGSRVACIQEEYQHRQAQLERALSSYQ